MKLNKRFFVSTGLFFLICTNLFTILGFLGNFQPVLDLLSHFRWQYAALQLLALCILLFRKPRHWRQVFLTSLLLLVNGWQVAKYIPIPITPPTEETLHFSMRVMQMNVFVFNREHQKAINAIRQATPDIVSIQEVTPTWFQSIQNSAVWKAYPYKLVDLREKNILLSRLPFQSAKTVFLHEKLGKIDGSVFIAQVQGPGNTPITILSLHPPIPLPGAAVHRYQRFLNTLKQTSPSLTRPLILIGDLNTTPWSIFYHQYLDILNLKDARIAQRFLPTWPTYFPPLQIPIDQVFTSPDIYTSQHRLGSFTGSDHFPIIVDLRIPITRAPKSSSLNDFIPMRNTGTLRYQ